MEIRIRKYCREDYPALRMLLDAAYGSGISQEVLEREYLTEKRAIFVAAAGESDQTVGCMFTEVQEDFVRPSRMLYVTYVAVDAQFRRLGIGKMLLEEALRQCRQTGCSAIELTSANFRTGAHAFYLSQGFTKKDTTVFIRELAKTV